MLSQGGAGEAGWILVPGDVVMLVSGMLFLILPKPTNTGARPHQGTDALSWAHTIHLEG